MNKQDFFTIIREGLNDFPKDYLNDILKEYEETFSKGISQGKTEEEILKSIDNPFMIVNNYRNNYLPTESQISTTKIDTNENNENTDRDNNYTNHTSTNHSSTPTQRNNNNRILKIIITALILVLFAPFLIAIFGVVIGLLISLIAIPFSLLVGGSGLLLGKYGVKVIGFTIPEFLIDFPIDVAVLTTLGSLFATIFFIILAYYFIKLIVIWIKKLISNNSNKGV